MRRTQSQWLPTTRAPSRKRCGARRVKQPAGLWMAIGWGWLLDLDDDLLGFRVFPLGKRNLQDPVGVFGRNLVRRNTAGKRERPQETPVDPLPAVVAFLFYVAVEFALAL